VKFPYYTVWINHWCNAIRSLLSSHCGMVFRCHATQHRNCACWNEHELSNLCSRDSQIAFPAFFYLSDGNARACSDFNIRQSVFSRGEQGALRSTPRMQNRNAGIEESVLVIDKSIPSVAYACLLCQQAPTRPFSTRVFYSQDCVCDAAIDVPSALVGIISMKLGKARWHCSRRSPTSRFCMQKVGCLQTVWCSFSGPNNLRVPLVCTRYSSRTYNILSLRRLRRPCWISYIDI